jgi:hypothetical protein
MHKKTAHEHPDEERAIDHTLHDDDGLPVDGDGSDL